MLQGIQIADFYLVKRRNLDIPALYQPHARYRYHWGINWRALAALVCSIIPCMPGLAYNVNPDVQIGGAIYISNFNWYYGIFVAFGVHAALSLIWPAKESLVPCMIESIDNAMEDQPGFEKDTVVVRTSEEEKN